MIEMSKSIDRIILLSGTPSLSRPYDIYNQINILWPRALGKDKDEFANNYCLARLCQGHRAQTYKDYSKGIRLEELNVLLSQTVMIRRLKDHVMTQLPPKRRQIIELELRQSDILLATTSCRIHNEVCMDEECQNESEVIHCSYRVSDGAKDPSSFSDNKSEVSSRKLSNQEIGLAKLSGFQEWFSNLAAIRDSEDTNSLVNDAGFSKMIIFAHHLKVLDGIQEIVCEKEIQFVRIDGGTLARDRQVAVEAFNIKAEVKVAIIGITAGGVGLDFSSAQNVVFLELPKSASQMLQAEDRAHRRGQTNAVNIYIFCAKDTPDEPHWMHLNKSLFRVSSMMNGSDYAIKEIEVDKVFYLYRASNSQAASEEMSIANKSNNGNSGNDVEQKVADNSSIEMDPIKSEVDKVFYQDLDQLSGMHENMEDTDKANTHIGQFSISKCTQVKENIQPDFVENVELKADPTLDKMPIGADVLTTTGSDNPNRNELLHFEVSRYTRRVHLYTCIQGKDSRPRPLFQSFRPDELDSLLYSTGITTKGPSLCILKENPAYYNTFQKFIKEWNDLRPIDQNKLFGKPLQLPLRLELCYINDTINHDCGGLLKGGSKRRNTPLNDITHPLPENAFWKKVALRGGLNKEKVTQAWTVSGEALCKLCQEPCTGTLAKTPEYFQDLFCKFSCFQEYRIRISQRALREALFQIEHGVCTLCKLDCHQLVRSIKPLSVKRRQEYILKVAPKLVNKKKLLLKLVNDPSEGNAWHADHIIPVHNGGGECGLENMRTLCVACHSDVTVDQRAELRLRNKRYTELVDSFRKKEEVDRNSEHTDSTADKKAEGSDEESLFVTVPGSSYSREIREVTANQENEDSTRE